MPLGRFSISFTVYWRVALLLTSGAIFTCGAPPGTWPAIAQVKCQLILRGPRFSSASLTCDGSVTLGVAPELKPVLKTSPGQQRSVPNLLHFTCRDILLACNVSELSIACLHDAATCTRTHTTTCQHTLAIPSA
jgi:hypothetical protein